MNIPSVRKLAMMPQPIFKNAKGKFITYGDTSKKDLIRICYIFSKEAQKFLQGTELFKRKFSAMILLHGTECPKCAGLWAEEGEVVKFEDEV